MVAACRFQDGAVIIADSRATWLGGNAHLFQDSLQKILPLGERTAIAFAGDVQAAGQLVHQLRKRISKKPRLRILRKLAAEVPRIAKHYYGLHRAQIEKKESLALVLGGITSSGIVEIWRFESPHFESYKLESGFLVVGTGNVVATYIQENLGRFDREFPSLKARADALLVGLEGDLQKKGIDTVGGLLQVILLDSSGIHPLRHGFITLDPEGPANAKTIEMNAGRWVQHNLATSTDVPLMEPAELLRSLPTELRFHDFHILSKGSTSPKWHLTYFLTCLAIQADVGTIEFRGVVSSIASPHYPLSINIPVAVGLWGTPGDYELKFSLVRDGERQVVHNEPIHLEYLPDETDLAVQIFLNIPAPGPAYLECQIANQTLGRRALYFGNVSDTPPASEEKFVKFARQQSEALLEAQRACSDPILEESGESTLVYFSICHNCSDHDTTLKFEGQMMAVFWKSYPLKLRLFIASAFRMPEGEHHLRVDLVNAATREVSAIATLRTSSTSSCIVAPIHGELIAIVPCPGIYFVNTYVDGQLVATAPLPAETDRPQYSFNLTQEDTARVAAGELLILLKRPRQQPHSPWDRSSSTVQKRSG